MTIRNQIAALRARLASIRSERDAWRAAGRMARYLAACSVVESLERRLAQLEAGAAAEPPADDLSDLRAREMAQLCITFNGRHSGDRGYRCTRLADAVNHARLDRSRAFLDDPGREEAVSEPFTQPSDYERVVMGRLGIRWAEGAYWWRDYRCERLADALAYARRAAGK